MHQPKVFIKGRIDSICYATENNSARLQCASLARSNRVVVCGRARDNQRAITAYFDLLPNGF